MGLFMTVIVGLSLLFGEGQIARAEDLHTAQEGDTIAFIAEAHGVSIDALAAANGLDPAAALYAGQSLTIPDGSASAVTAADGSSSSTVLDGVLAYQQARSLSCEYASVFIATSVFGNPIYEEEYIGSIPSSANPHYGFRGNID
ncbi:MAG: LysM peptidoglycan-binding domain-containing protein, partial [Chloroflexota bacterium]|nr:LysM peptidoglycan-binding domain-containing protein [Chloroflexota bacterium]